MCSRDTAASQFPFHIFDKPKSTVKPMMFGYYTFAIRTSAALSSLRSLILSFQLSSSHLSVTLFLLIHVLQKHQEAILLPSTICH